MSKILLRRYLPLDTGFRENGKVLHLKKKHGALYDSVIRSLIWIWIECRCRYQDGVLSKDAEDIELMADWTGEEGKFIEIVTSPKTRFLKKVSDNEYHMHNWYKNNPDLNPKRKNDISRQNSGNAHKRYHQEDLDCLAANGIEDYTKVPWFKNELSDIGRITIDLKKMPSKIDIRCAGEYFTKMNGLWEWFNHRTKDERYQLLKIIKANTRRCGGCNTVFVSTEVEVCPRCEKE
jgi:hypothetical protein